MTKQQEIEFYKMFLDSLPKNGYLAGILEGSGTMIEQMITSDFAFPAMASALREMQRDIIGTRETLAEAYKKISAEEVKLETLKRQSARISAEISQMKKSVLALC